MNNKIFREGIIIALLFLVIIFAIGILFYDTMSADVEDIASIEYKTSSSVNEVLTEIEANSGVDLKTTQTDSLLKSYSITEEDLYVYASDNYYESGKKDPFAESSETISERVTTTTQKGSATNSQTSNPLEQLQTEQAKQDKKEDETTKVTTSETKDKPENKTEATTGTFFENKNSK